MDQTHDELLVQFVSITSSDTEVAKHFLEKSKWNLRTVLKYKLTLENALDSFMGVDTNVTDANQPRAPMKPQTMKLIDEPLVPSGRRRRNQKPENVNVFHRAALALEEPTAIPFSEYKPLQDPQG
jgi:hypothetical protein